MRPHGALPTYVLAVAWLATALTACAARPVGSVVPTPRSGTPSDSAGRQRVAVAGAGTGPASAVRSWVGAVDLALATGGTGPLTASVTPDCPCARLALALAAAWAGGGRVVGARWELRTVVVPAGPPALRDVTVVFASTAYTQRRGDGSSVSVPGFLNTDLIRVARTGSGWRVAAVVATARVPVPG